MKKSIFLFALFSALVLMACRKNSITMDVSPLANKTSAAEKYCFITPPPTCPPCVVEYNPVCGCDGVTYFNACIAICVGVSSYKPGACNSIGVDNGGQ